LAEQGGVQWPLPAGSDDARQERRLFEDEAPRPLPEPTSEKFPFILITGRGTVAQWHTQTRTAKSAMLRKLYPSEAYVEINPSDAKRLRVRSGDALRISSQRGQLEAHAVITPGVQPGQLFLPMHDEATNRLTDAVFDPYSHQPAYKACAATVERCGG
jgi:assimilatory nitrate reductase catalytic subunit